MLYTNYYIIRNYVKIIFIVKTMFMPESYLQIIKKSYMKIVLNFTYSFLIGRTLSRKKMSYWYNLKLRRKQFHFDVIMRSKYKSLSLVINIKARVDIINK